MALAKAVRAMPSGLLVSVSLLFAGAVPALAIRLETKLPTAPDGAGASSVWLRLRTGLASKTGASLVPVTVIVTVEDVLLASWPTPVGLLSVALTVYVSSRVSPAARKLNAESPAEPDAKVQLKFDPAAGLASKAEVSLIWRDVQTGPLIMVPVRILPELPRVLTLLLAASLKL